MNRSRMESIQARLDEVSGNRKDPQGRLLASGTELE